MVRASGTATGVSRSEIRVSPSGGRAGPPAWPRRSWLALTEKQVSRFRMFASVPRAAVASAGVPSCALATVKWPEGKGFSKRSERDPVANSSLAVLAHGSLHAMRPHTYRACHTVDRDPIPKQRNVLAWPLVSYCCKGRHVIRQETLGRRASGTPTSIRRRRLWQRRSQTNPLAGAVPI
jgi:hypothetical protein